MYGTLRRGGANAGLLKQALYLGEWHTQAGYRLFDCGSYPGAMERGGLSLTGEVYAVSQKIFRRLDVLEGYPRLYTRKRIATSWGQAWVYLLRRRPFSARAMACGDWMAHNQSS